MLLSSFLKSLSKLRSTHQASRINHRRNPRHWRTKAAREVPRVAVEHLENRTLLSSVTVEGTLSGDDIFVTDASATHIAVTINGTTTNHEKPAAGSDLTFFIDAKGGVDTITVIGDVSLPGVEFELQAEEIIVSTTAKIGAGDVSFTAKGADAGLSIADSLPIGASIGDRSLIVEPGAQISAGDVTLGAERVNSLLHGFRPFGGSDNGAQVTVNGATINATGDVSITTKAADENLTDDIPETASNAGTDAAVNFASGFFFDGLMPSIPLALMIRKSETSITIDGATTITADGNVKIAADSVTDATTSAVNGNYGDKTNSGIAKFLDSLSVGYSQADASSTVSLTGTTSITAGGKVDINSKAKSIAAVTATVKRNTTAGDVSSSNATDRSPSDTNALGASFAMSNTRTTALATITDEVVINADGNVNINAEGDVTNKAKAGLKIYVDGRGGLAVAVGLDETDVVATVDGKISSAADTTTTVNLPLTAIDDSTDIINIDGHGLTDGEIITYRAIDLDNPEDEDGNEIVRSNIGGLADGLEYRVIVIDDDHFQLAQGVALEIDGRAIPAGQQHTFSQSEVVEFNPASSVNTDADVIGLQTDQLTEGSFVTYQMADSDPDANGDPEPITGLIDGESYLAINVQQTGSLTVFQLADLQDPTTPLDLSDVGAGDAHFFGFHRSGTNAISFAPNSSIDENENTIDLPDHGLQTGDVLSYETDRDAPVQRRNTTRHTFLLPPQTLGISATSSPDALDIDADSLTVLDAVEFSTGHRIVYNSADSAIGGLVSGNAYFVIRLEDSTKAANGFQLAATKADALNGNAINLTGTLTGDHSFTADPIHANELAIRNHSFETGQQIIYRAEGSESAGLSDGQTYFAIRRDGNRLSLAGSRTEALAGVALPLIQTFAVNDFQRFETTTVVELFDATRSQSVVDPTGNTLYLPGHQLIEGATVVYRTSGEAPGDVAADTTYRVNVVDGDHIRLLDENTRQVVDLEQPTNVGNGFHFLDVLYADIDTSTDVLFLSDHGLQLDDIVEYSADGDTSIGGLTDGERYGVNFLNGDEIQLLELDEDDVPTEVVVAISDGATFDAVHQLVLIDEASDDDPEPLLFTPAVLSPPSGITQLTFDANALPAVDTAANTVRVLYHGLQTGDTVRYLSDSAMAGGSDVGGLTNGQQYEVVVVDQHTYRLQSGGSFVNLTSAATGDGRHAFERANTINSFQSPVRGLDDRAFYYVSVVDENTIQLAETAGDAAALQPIDLDSTLADGDLHQLQVFAAPGIGIASKLTAKNEVQAGSGLGGAPKFTDLLFSGDTQSPFSFTDPSSFKNPKEASSLQRGIVNNDAKGTLRGGGGEQNDSFSVAAGLAVTQVDHNVATEIGSNAVLTSDFDVNISSEIKQKIKLKAEGTVSSDDKTADSSNPKKPKKRDKDKKFAFGAGIAVGFYENSAIVDIQSGASIDASNDVEVDAKVTYPLKANPISLLPFGGYFEPDGKSPEDVDFIGEIKSLIGGKLGLDDIVNVWANSKAGGSGTKDGGAAKVALSGSIAVTDYENTAKVIVGSGVDINQDVSRQNLSQSVSIDSAVLMELVSVAGQISIGLNKEGIQNAHKKRISGEKWASKLFSFYGNQAGEVGIGGSALSQSIDNTVEALVETGARIYTGIDGRLAVNATEDVFTFEFVQSGGKSGKLGISGTVSVIQQDSHTVAHLQNGVTVTGGDVQVDADNRTRHIALLGAIQASKSLGIGVTVGVQLIERNTLAIVGSERVTVAPSAVDDDKDRIRIPAHGFTTGDRVVYHASSAPISGLIDGQTYFVVKDNERHIQLATSSANAMAENPIVLAIDADNAGDDHQFELPDDGQVFNFESTDVNVAFSNITVPNHVLQTGDAVQYSHGSSSAAGGIGPSPGLLFIIRLTDDRIQLAQTRADALAGNALSLSTIGATGTQQLQRVLFFNVTDVAVNATNGGYIASVGIAGANVSNTESSDEATEEQNPSSEGATGVLDAASEVGLAGGSTGSFGGIGDQLKDNNSSRKSGVGIAGDASWNQLEERALAIINNNGWIHATDLDATAADTTDVYAISGAVAIANADDTAIAIAGSFNRNKIDMSTEAIVAGSTLDLDGRLSVAADRTGDLIGISLGIAGSKVSNNSKKGQKSKGFAFGGSVSVNTIDNVTRATIDDVVGRVDGPVTAKTGNDSVIFALGGGAGVAINGQVGFGAGVGVNTVRTTTASLIDNAELDLNSTIDVTATNDILLESLGISAGIGQFGIAGTVAVNEINPATSSTIRNSELQLTNENVTLTSLDKSRIRADAGGVAIGIKAADADDNESAVAGAFGVAISLNQIGTGEDGGTIALIEDSMLNNAGNVVVDAESEAQITGLTLAGSVAIAKQSGSTQGSLALAGAGAGSRNVLTTDIVAAISNTTLLLPADVRVTAIDHARIHADAGGFGISASLNSGSGSSNAVSVGVGVAVNDLFGETYAAINDSDVFGADQLVVNATAEDPGDDRAIEALAMGGSVAVGIGTGGGQSGAFAGAGAITRNRIFRNVTAAVVDAQVFADSIEVTAFDQATINADAGGVSIAISASTNGGSSGSGSIGVSVGINEIGSQADGAGMVQTLVSGSSLTAPDGITVDAASTARIDAVTIAGSLAVGVSSGANSFSGSGAVTFSDNVMEKTIAADVLSSTLNTTGGNIVVSAADDAFIRSVVVGAAISVSAAASGTSASLTIGASIAHNTIDNDTRAIVDASSLTAGGSITVRSTADSTSLGNLPSTIPAALIAPSSPVGNLLDLFRPANIFPDVLTMASLLDELATTEGDNKDTDGNERKFDEDLIDPLMGVLLSQIWNDPAYLGGDLSDKFKVTFMSSDEIDEADQADIGNRATGNGWMIADRRNFRTYQVLELDDGTLQVRSVNIQAISAAASVSVAAGTNSVSIAGAGASTRNIVLSNNEAIVRGESSLTANGTTVGSNGDVQVEARKVHGIVSTVVAAAVGVGVSSGGAGGAGAIGASLARNFIGYEADGTRDAASATARIDDSKATASGMLNVDALTSQKITTVVIAASVGVSASTGGAGAGLSGAGSSAINRIAADADANIRNVDASDLTTDQINITALDQSMIRATAGAVAVAVGFAPDVAVSISLGVGLARNTITSESTATISDSTITATDADLNLKAFSTATTESVAFAASVSIAASASFAAFAFSGAGAEATNIIQTKTDALITNSDISGLDNVSINAESQAEIEATVVSIAVGVGYGTGGGFGAAIGVSLARNFIGFEPDTDFTATYTTADTDSRSVAFGQTVEVASGVRAGDVYRYIGRDENGVPNTIAAPDNFDDNIPEELDVSWLATIDFGKSNQWELVNLQKATSSVKAQIEDSTLNLNEDLFVIATGSQTINSIVVAGSAAIGGGGLLSGALGGSGVAAVNRIANTVVADIVSSPTSNVTNGPRSEARNVRVAAIDESMIDVFAGAVSLAASFSAGFSVSVALGVSVARNEITNDVTAAIRDTNFRAADDISVLARESSSIEATSFAASMSVALAGTTAALAFSGAGADAINSINNQTFAFVEDSSLTALYGDLVINASNTASIDAEVVAVSAAVSIGFAAASGSIGAALTRNEIGGGSGPDQHETRAYALNSNLFANPANFSTGSGKVSITASSQETIRSVGAAGAVAIAIGAGFGGAGTGTDVVSKIAGTTQAQLDGSRIVSADDIEIIAVDDSRIVDVEAVGAAVAGGFIAGAIGVTLVENSIQNNIDAVVSGASEINPSGGNITIAANSRNTIGTASTPIVAATASVSAGAGGFSGAGVDVGSTIGNNVNARITDGSRIVGSYIIAINADEDSEIYADAAAVAASFSIGVAGGVAVMDATINSDVGTDVSDAFLFGTIVRIGADSRAHIPKNFTVGVAGSIGVGVTQNRATTTVAPLTTTDIVNSEIRAFVIEVRAAGDHLGQSEADGGAFGGVADTGMVANTIMGRGHSVDEVQATVRDGSQLIADTISILATSNDDVTALTTAASVGIVAVEASKSRIQSDIQPRAAVDNATLTATNVTITSQHDQLLDAQADSFSLGVGSGSGAGLEVLATGGAVIDVDNSATIIAQEINIEAVNNAQRKRDINGNSRDLYVAPFALLSVSEVMAQTQLGTPTQPLQAKINLGDGAALVTVEKADGQPSELNVTALNNINARQILEVEGSSTIAITTGINELVSTNEAVINTDNATLTNRFGDVLLNASTDAKLTSDGELLIFSLGGGGGVDAKAQLTSDNTININGGEIVAEEVQVWAGRRFNNIGGIQRGDLDAITNTGVTTASLVNIDDTIPTTTVDWGNTINVTGDATVFALRDVNLLADRYLQTTPEAIANGNVLNLSFGGIGQGLEVDDSNTEVAGEANVQIAGTTDVRGGLESESVVIIRPVSINGTTQRGGDRIGEELTAADKVHFGLSPNVDFHFAPLADGLPLTVTDSTVVRVASGHTAGGTVGRLYRFTGSQPELVVLENENYLSAEWRPISENDVDDLALYNSNLAARLDSDLQGQFFAIQNVDQPQLRLSVTNLGVQLTSQLRDIDDWIASHAGDAEAIARYQVQKDALRQTIEDLGLFTERTLTNGTVERILNPDFDAVFVSLPDVEATPGSVFIEGTSNATAAVAAGALRASGNAHIELRNNAPFNMVTGAAKINDNRRVTYIDGQLVTLTAGRVYENFVPVDPPSASIDNEIEIRHVPLNLPGISINGGSIPDVPQDLYINGDVVNEDGRLVVQNLSGSINVNGTLRANPIEIESARDFNLNTEGWLHAGGDPRQLLNWDTRRNTALSGGTYVESSPSSDLKNAINNDSSIISNGNINITARYLNVNGLIQSGVTEIELTLNSAFQPEDGQSLIQANGEPFAGVVFGQDTPTTAVQGRFDESRTDRGAIVIDPLAPAGGSILIAGQIFSTGNGRLIAASGEADILINNRTDHDLVIEGIDNSADRTGRITIVDTRKLNRTVYTNTANGTTEEFFTGQFNAGSQTVTYSSLGSRNYVDGESVEYFPASGNQLSDSPAGERLRYTWVDGQDSSIVTTETYTANGFNLFGVNNSVSDALRDDEFRVSTDGPNVLQNQPLLISEDLQAGVAGPNGIPALRIDYEQLQLASQETISEPIITGGKWLRPFSVTIGVETSEVNKQVFTSSLRADYPISIGFSDSSSTPTINLRSERDLILAGNVDASEDGRVELTTPFGFPIESQNNAALFGATLNVNAGNKTDLLVEGGMVITANVVSDLTISAISEDNQTSTIDIREIDAAGDVLLIGPHGIRRGFGSSLSETHISGRNIELVANDGDIGTNFLRINTAANGGFAASADGFILVEEVTGDLTLIAPATRPGEASVKSNGLVLLTAEGAIIDGVDEEPSYLTEEQAQQLNDRLRLFGDLAEDAAFEQVDTEQRQDTAQYHDYWRIVREATFGATERSVPITGFLDDGNFIDLAFEGDFGNGSPVFYEVGFDLTDTDFAADSSLWTAVTTLEDGDTLDYDVKTLTSGNLTVMNPGEIVSDATGNLFQYIGSAVPLTDLRTDVPYYLASGNERIALAGDRYPAAVFSPDRVLIEHGYVSGNFDQVRFSVRTVETIAWADVDLNNLSPQDRLRFEDFHNSLAPSEEYDANFIRRLSSTEVQDRIDARTINEDQIRFALSGAVTAELFPTAERSSIFGSGFNSEINNIKAASIFLTSTSVGSLQSATNIDFSQGFAALPEAQKALLAASNPSDIVGRLYTSWQYVGESLGSTDLTSVDFGGADWLPLVPDYVTSVVDSPSQVLPFDLVLNDAPNNYGLYRYIAEFPINNPNRQPVLSRTNYNDRNIWERLSPTHNLVDGTVNLQQNDVVQDRSDLQSVTLQPLDDLNVESELLWITATNDVAIESFADIIVRQVTGADVRLQTSGDIIAESTDFGVQATGNAFLRATSVTGVDADATGNSRYLPVQIGQMGTLGGSVEGDFFARQLEEDFDDTIVSSLRISRIDANGDVDIKVDLGNLNLGYITSENTVTLDARAIFNAEFRDVGELEWNILAETAVLNADTQIGFAGFAEVGVQVTGGLFATAPARILINSPVDLPIGSVDGGSVNLVSGGSISLPAGASIDGSFIRLTSFNDFSLDAAASITATGDVNILADTLGVDDEGAIVTLAGTIAAQSTLVGTGDDDDFVDATLLATPFIVTTAGGDDRILGGLSADTINAGSGNDHVAAGPGPDEIRGGTGDDELYGGLGSDLYVFEDVGLVGEQDLISELPGEGTDDVIDFTGTARVQTADPISGDLVTSANRSVRLPNSDQRSNFEFGLNIDPLIYITAAPTEMLTGVPGDFEATWYDVGSQMTTHVSEIDWGDLNFERGTLIDNGDNGTISGQHVYQTSGQKFLQFTITDGLGNTASQAAIVNVTNPNPTAVISGPYLIEEGNGVTLYANDSFDEAGNELTYRWDIDGDGDFDELISGVSPTLTWQQLVDLGLDDGPYAGNVTVEVTNDFSSDTATTILEIANDVPDVDLQLTPEIDENGLATLAIRFNDGGSADTHTVTVNWGDGSDVEVVSLPLGERTLELTHRYLNNLPGNDSYAIDVTVRDDDGAIGSASANVVVNNVSPVIDDVRVASSIDENGTVTLEVDFSDIGTQDTHTIVVDWGDGGDVEEVSIAVGAYSLTRTHQYLDDESGTADDLYQISVRVLDSDGAETTSTKDLLVNNVSPVLINVVSSTDSFDCISHDRTVTISGEFSDIGTLDTHTVTIDWGDGSSPTIVTPTTTEFSLDHNYNTGGLFTVSVKIEDDDGGMTTQTVSALLTGTQLSDGILRVYGTDARDIVKAWQNHGRVYLKTKLGSNSWTYESFPAANVDHVEVVTCNGDDFVWLKTAAYVSTNVVTGNGRDRIYTANGVDEIDAGSGNDYIFSYGGDDVIHAGLGQDYVSSGNGDDEVHAGGGHDRVYSGMGDDLVFAGAGNDHVDGGSGDDRIDGGSGNDCLSGQSGNDVMLGGTGHDRIYTGHGDNLVLAGSGNDLIYGGYGNDVLVGGAGHDCIHGSKGNDIIIGGLGSDWIDGDNGRDLLIADSTDFDDDEESLVAIFTEWNGSASWADKIRNLRSGDGHHLNGTRLEAGTTVHDDSAVDNIWGGRGNDWYFASQADRLRDRRWRELWDRTN